MAKRLNVRIETCRDCPWQRLSIYRLSVSVNCMALGVNLGKRFPAIPDNCPLPDDWEVSRNKEMDVGSHKRRGGPSGPPEAAE